MSVSIAKFWRRVFQKPEPSYEEYQCTECGYDRELIIDTWVCGHCGFCEVR